MSHYQLKDYLSLRFSHNVPDLLNGLTTNSLDAPQNAFVNGLGKIICTFWQIQQNNHLNIIIPKTSYLGLLNHIERYRALTQTKIEIAHEQASINLETHNIDFTPTQSVSENEFLQYRLDNVLPLQGKDYTNQMILNVFPKHYVSFTKGCFLGQEVLARVHNLAKPPKKLTVVTVESRTPAERENMTSIYDGRGFLFVKN